MEVTQSKTIKWRDQLCKQRSGREHLGGATPWSTRSPSNKGAWSALQKKSSQMEQQGPQAGRPMSAGLASFYTPRSSPSVGKSFAQFLVRVLELIV
jgi:hypothetical protein